MSMTINAVSTSVPFDIKAALQHPEVKGVARILAKAGIARPTSKFKASELEASLAEGGLTTQERIAAKLALDRAKLIDWAA
jgi:hypothetical protein